MFVDRDGTLIEDRGFICKPDDVRLLIGVPRALRRLQNAGFVIVLVSNQSGIGRGYITVDQAAAVHQRMIDELHHQSVALGGCYYCSHLASDCCLCRKPSPGMLIDAAKDLSLSLKDSWMIGDKASDVEAGWQAGCRTVLIGVGGRSGRPNADYIITNWSKLADLIINQQHGVPKD